MTMRGEGPIEWAAQTAPPPAPAVSGGGALLLDGVAVGGGGGPVARAFPFALNSPGISAPGGAIPGFPVYTPTVGDLLLDAWITIETAWDGTTPQVDLGTDFNGGEGLLSKFLLPRWDLAVDDSGYRYNAGIQSGYALTLASLCELDQAQVAVEVDAGSPPGLKFRTDGVPSWYNFLARVLPARFSAADPIKVVVSRDGRADGADPGSTQGAATLYLLTATPV